jgi:hypothetical protein
VTDPRGVSWSVIQWGFGLFCLLVLAIWGSIQAVLFVLGMMPFSKVSVTPRLASLLVSISCVCACVVRIPYYVVDPFAWQGLASVCTLTRFYLSPFQGVIDPCAIWTVDYLSTLLVGVAYLFLLFQWMEVVKRFRTEQSFRSMFSAFQGLFL